MPRSDTVTGHDLVADALQAMGVTHCYGVPAVPIYPTFGACARRGIRPVGTRHQQGAALMAAAHNYFAGRHQSVLLMSPGPASTNTVTGMLVARDNGWPLVGGYGAEVLHASELEATLRWAMSRDRACCVSVRVDPHAAPLRR